MVIWSAEIKELARLHGSFKGQLPELEKELGHLIKSDDANVVMLYSRRCLEVIITDLCECELKRDRGTEPLKGIIDKLRKEKKVPSNIITSMDHLNSLSVYGAHPKDFDPEQVKPVLNNLDIIIKWYLKYKDKHLAAHPGAVEDKSESKEVVESTESVKKSGKSLIILLSGLTLIVVIVILGLFVSKIIGRGEQTRVPERSIAVLPFKYLSDESDKQYLADGMMDAILLHLSKINTLRVLDRTSVEQYRETTKTSGQISRELDVEYLLEGSFQKHEDNTRLIVQLIRPSEGGHVWAQEYNNKWNEIFSVQSEVAKAIASQLNAVILPEEKNQIEKIPTDNLEAYDYYLLGEYLRSQRTPESLWKAKTFYEKSIKADPEFVRAYYGLAHCYGNLAFWANIRPAEAYPLALDLAYKALELDSLFAEAYKIIGMVELYYNFDFISAENFYKKALEFDQGNLAIYSLYAELLFFKGEYSEAIEMDHRAMAIDPTFIINTASYGAHLYYAHQKDSAISHLLRTSERDPSCHFDLGIIYAQEGEYEKSVSELKKILIGFSPVSMTYLGLVYSRSGAEDETKRILDTLENRAKNEFVPFSMRGVLLAEMGLEKEALNYLKKGYDEREEFLLLLANVDTMSYSNLRKNAKYVEIMGKLRVEE